MKILNLNNNCVMTISNNGTIGLSYPPSAKLYVDNTSWKLEQRRLKIEKIMNKMENTHRKLIELKEYLDNNSLNGTHLSNLPCYFWEILGECIDETKEVESKVTPNELESIEYIKRIRELISLGDTINFKARLIHLERMILDDVSKAKNIKN